jgi:rare lipoprotein A (peptidoglycan hydrolase)
MVIRLRMCKRDTKIALALSVVAGTVAGLLIAAVTAASTQAVHVYANLYKTPQASSASGSSQGGSLAAIGTGTPAKKLGVIHGLASWYGGVFDGRTTASGEKFDMHALTACHPTLPFGSLVRVINRHNKKSVVVRINDRGDLVTSRRVIDLSWAAAQKLAMTRTGLAKVDVEVISLGEAQPGN